MQNVGIMLFSVLAILAGVILLEIWLSRREGKWPGLVLPILSGLWSLLYPLSMAAGGAETEAPLAALALVLLFANLPTAVLLAIYAACREKRRQRRQMERMNIQDLD